MAEDRMEIPIISFGQGPSTPPAPPGASIVPGELRVDVPTLIRTRALIQADSGGGKSYLLRSLLEQTAGVMPQVIFDLEGEFSSLRHPLPDGTRLPYIVVSATEGEGDVPADPAMAGALCRAIAEARASVVLDLYDLDEGDQRRFARDFLSELLSLPRALYEPRAVVVDEAERLAPQSGSSEATAALASLSKRGRKRRLMAVFAIQRLSDFDNAVAGGLKNRFFGMQTLDTDVLRAGNSLGFDKKRRQTLLDLDPLTFYCHGPALPTREAVLGRAGEVLTPHGEEADRLAARAGTSPPPPPESLGDLLARLADMSPEPAAGQEPEELHRRIDELREELARARRLGPDPGRIEAEVERRTNERLPLEAERAAAPLRERIASLESTLGTTRGRLQAVTGELDSALDPTVNPGLDSSMDSGLDPAPKPAHDAPDRPPAFVSPPTPAAQETGREVPGDEEDGNPADASWPEVDPDDVVPFHVQGGPKPEDLPPAELRILEELEKLRTLGVKTVDRRNLAVLAGRSPRSSSYEAHVSALRGRRLLSYPSPGRLGITALGRTVARLALGWLHDPPSHDSKEPTELHEAWIAYLPEPRAKILRALLGHHPNPVRREELASLVGQSSRSSSFEDHVRVLKALGVAEYPEPGAVRASPLLFPAAPKRP